MMQKLMGFCTTEIYKNIYYFIKDLAVWSETILKAGTTNSFAYHFLII